MYRVANSADDRDGTLAEAERLMLLDGKAWAWPPRLTVEATMTLGDVDGAPTIVSSVLYFQAGRKCRSNRVCFTRCFVRRSAGSHGLPAWRSDW